MKTYISWTELKTVINNRNLHLQYVQKSSKYTIFAVDGTLKYTTELWTDTSNIKGIDISQNNIDIQDFEDNYKNNANKSIEPKTFDGRTMVRAESKPIECTTCFTCIGDSDTNIGDGKPFLWDFSNSDDIVNYNSGDEFKTKRIEFGFLDAIYIKEGAIYFHNAPLGSYIDLQVVCPAGNYYIKNDGSPAYAQEDTVISHYVRHHFISGDCSMGDELNTEACSNEIPANYKFRIEITVPSSCNDCTGHVSLELYRTRTLIL